MQSALEIISDRDIPGVLTRDSLERSEVSPRRAVALLKEAQEEIEMKGIDPKGSFLWLRAGGYVFGPVRGAVTGRPRRYCTQQGFQVEDTENTKLASLQMVWRELGTFGRCARQRAGRAIRITMIRC